MIRATPNIRRAACAVVIALAALAPTACATSSTESTEATSSAPLVSNQLNPASLTQIADAVAAGGLPVTNRAEATSSLCGSAGCTDALTTDQFTLMTFPSTGRATIYAGEHLDTFQVLDVVVTFPAGSSDDEQSKYQAAIERVLR